jgi:hypothetical protein
LNNEFVTNEELKEIFADNEIEIITTPYDNDLEKAIDDFMLAIIEALRIEKIMNWLSDLADKIRSKF